MGKLTGQNAIVTGGASGFGAGIVESFIDHGASVLIADRDAAGGEALARKLGGTDGRCEFIQTDVTGAGDVDAAIARCEQAFGSIDIMVANAGLGQRPCRFEDTPDEIFDNLMDVNVRGVFLCVRACVGAFRQRGRGNIIITASGIALTPRPNLVPYAISKGAVVSLAKGLAAELADSGVRVNAICPAVGDTPMLSEFMGGELDASKRSAFEQSVPMGRLINGHDIGEAAAWLASSESAMVTGSALAVDGGRCI